MSTVSTPSDRSRRIHAAILDAAGQVFLRDGYVGASMDEVAKIASASKQTVYKHFGSKEQLFVELVTSMTMTTGDPLGHETTEASADVAGALTSLAEAMLDAVLEPRILRLRRLVIGEANRFPELGRALFQHGPERAITGVERRLRLWVDRGALPPHDEKLAAQHYNWLVMGAPLNAAMLLGDEAIPSPTERRAHAASSVAALLRTIGVQA